MGLGFELSKQWYSTSWPAIWLWPKLQATCTSFCKYESYQHIYCEIKILDEVFHLVYRIEFLSCVVMLG